MYKSGKSPEKPSYLIRFFTSGHFDQLHPTHLLTFACKSHPNIEIRNP